MLWWRSWIRLQWESHEAFTEENNLDNYYVAYTTFMFSCSVMSDSLWPHGLQHASLPCPSPSPSACSNSCPLSWWYHPTTSSSVVPFSSWLQSFSGSESFPMNHLFTSGGQRIGDSASVPMSIQDWFPLGLTDWLSLQSQGLSRVFSNTTVQKHQLFGTQAFFMIQLSHPYMTTEKNIALTTDLCWQCTVSAF